MWRRSYTTKVKGVSAERIWKVWSDVDRWASWQEDLEFAKLEGPFEAGSTFLLKPKGGPGVRIELLEVVQNRGFIDLTRFFLSRMYGSHQFVEKDGELEMTTSISIEGPLAFLWRRLVAQGIADKLQEQSAWLLRQAGYVPG